MDKINKLKERIANIEATNKNDIYSSNLYWSQNHSIYVMKLLNI